jgi:beta-phosphoglucomutase-like phosphatase (HAD superfamily)
MPVSAVIFDFDGVIADTERLHLEAFREVFAARGWPLDERAYFDRYLGFDDEGLVIAYGQDQRLKFKDEDVRTLVEAKTTAFSRHLSSPAIVYGDADACIRALAKRFKLGIASGAQGGEIVAILRAAGLTDLFKVIVAAENVTECKPSPMPYLTAAAKLGVDPADCVAVEDSDAGLEAARAAGMATVAITNTLPRHLLAIADHVIERLEELTPELVASLGTPRAL